MSKEHDIQLGTEIPTEPLFERQDGPEETRNAASRYIIEQLLSGIETSEKSKSYLNAVGDAAFMKNDEAFQEMLTKLTEFTQHTLDAFNHISRHIGGIPIRVLIEDSEIPATVVSLKSQQGNAWTFGCVSENGSDFSKTYSSASQLRSAHEAYVLTTTQGDQTTLDAVIVGLSADI